MADEPSPAAPTAPPADAKPVRAGALPSLATLVLWIALAATTYLAMTWLVYRLSIDTTTNVRVTSAFFHVATFIIILIEVAWLLAIGLVTALAWSLVALLANTIDTRWPAVSPAAPARCRRAANGGLYLASPLVTVTLVTLAIMPIQGRSASFAAQSHGVSFATFVDAMTTAMPLMYIVLMFLVCVFGAFMLLSHVFREPGIGSIVISVIAGVAAVFGLGALGAPAASLIADADVGVTGRLYLTFAALGLVGAVPMLLLRGGKAADS